MRCGALAALLLTVGALPAAAVSYTASYLDGSTWDTIYGQGFNPYTSDLLPGQPYEFGEIVPLNRWEFFKSGEADTATNIRLAIIEGVLDGQTGMYADIANMNINDPNGPVVGISTNTIVSTASIPTGAPIRFNFDGGLDLVFGNWYGAIMVNVDGSGNVTPVLVSALTADYLPAPGDPNEFYPETNYDFSADPNGRLPDPLDPLFIDFFTSASNFINPDMTFGTFLTGFDWGGDANFIAYFDTVFPPEGPPGDFDGDLDVDGDDLDQWEADYLVNGDSDANEDGRSDGLDFLIWQQNYTGPLPLAGIAAVPEPTSIGLACALGVGGALVRRPRRGRKR